MSQIINSWSDTLTLFLASSNEDERVVALFKDKILPKIESRFENDVFRWLEIGVGDGNKIKLIAQAISNLQKYNKINITVCDPSTEWLVNLQSPNIRSQFPHNSEFTFLNQSIEQYVSMNRPDEFHFISLVQVMYSASIKEAILKYIEVSPRNKPGLMWVDVEDKSGDFFQMRKRLSVYRKEMVYSMGDELILELKERGISYDVFFTSKKICNINIVDILTSDNHWLFPFILGYNMTDYIALPLEERMIVMSTVRDFVSNLQSPVLNIPDISVLIYL